MPAEYAFDQLMASQIYRNSIDLHTRQDFRTPAEEIVRLLMYPNVHSFLVYLVGGIIYRRWTEDKSFLKHCFQHIYPFQCP